MAQKDKVKELVGRGLHSYHTKSLQQIDRIERKNKEQNHKISILTNELDNDYLTKTEEGSVVSLEHSKEGMIYLDELQGNTLVNYCVDGSKELTLNNEINVQGTNVTLTDLIDNGKVDVVCEGNTLVNLSNHFIDKEKTFTLNSGAWYNQVTICDMSMIKLNVDYTLIYDIEVIENNTTWVLGTNTKMVIGQSDIKDSLQSHPTIVNSISNNGKGTGIWDTPCYSNNKVLFNINTWNTSNSKYFSIRPIYCNQLKERESIKYKIKNLILLEGNWTSKEIPRYFEGMKSVAECENNKFEILSRNDNLFVPTQHIPNGWSNGSMITSSNYRTYWIECKPNTTYFIESNKSGNRFGVSCSNVIKFGGVAFPVTKGEIYGSSDDTNKVVNIIFTTDSTAKYLFVYTINNGVFPTPKIMISEGSSEKTYIEPRLNKKEISLNEPLRALPNGVKDKFIKQSGKWYIQRNCLEYKPTSNDGWAIDNGGVNGEGYLCCYTSKSFLKNDSSYISRMILCDKLPFGAKSFTKEMCCYSGAGYFEFVLKATTLDEFKARLDELKPTVIVPTLTPTYEEITDVELITYLDTTHISNNSTIPCNMKVANSGYNAIIKPSTQYTVALDTNKSGTIGMNLGGAKVTTTNNVATITTPATLADDSLRLYGKGINASKVRLLEGDKTNWIPSFFEGMKSSFEDKLQDDGTYKMEILSNNGNLINLEEQVRLNNKSGMSCSLKEYNGTMSWEIYTQSYIEYYNYLRCQYKPNTQYTMYFDCNMTPHDDRATFAIKVMYENSHTETFSMNKDTKNVQFTTLENRTVKKIYFSNWQYSGRVNIYNMKFCEGSDVLVEEKSNKIQFSSIEPLRSVDDIKDRFVFKDGKLMIERNCKSIRLNDETIASYTVYNTEHNGTMLPFSIRMKTVDTKKGKFVQIPCNCLATHEKPTYKSAEVSSIQQYIDSSACFVGSIKVTELTGITKDSLIEYFNNNNISITYQLAEPTYEEIPFELQKIILEGYENGTLFFDTNIPPTSTVTYAGETPIVKSVKLNKSEVLNNTTDINDNIVPYLMDMDYRVVCLQLEGRIESVSMAKLFGGTFEMLQRDILSNRYSKDEYKYRLDAYLSANKITEDEYNKLGDMLND